MTGLMPYGLSGNWCEECGRGKSFRLFPGVLTGCKTCDEVITRHRCTGRPDLGDLALGESWECPGCGGTWMAAEEEDTCGECGRSGMVKTWVVGTAPRLATAPRYEPHPYAPFRNALRGIAGASFSRPFRNEITLPAACYRAPGGFMVHVRSACRCRR